jgi:hypothetical protein
VLPERWFRLNNERKKTTCRSGVRLRTTGWLVLAVCSILCSDAVGTGIPAQAFRSLPSEDSAFADRYQLETRVKAVLGGQPVNLLLYGVRDSTLRHNDEVADEAVAVQTPQGQLRLPFPHPRAGSGLIYEFPRTRRPLICVQYLSYGNGWNANPFYVVGLDTTGAPVLLGTASAFDDLDGDGSDDFFDYEDVWEIGLPYFAHARAPTVERLKVFFGDTLNVSVEEYSSHYRNEARRIDDGISSCPREVPDVRSRNLLSLILRKFLILRLLDGLDAAWESFEADIRHYDDIYFCLASDVGTARVDSIPIEDIRSAMAESLHRKYADPMPHPKP